jgi:hypothetical protein
MKNTSRWSAFSIAILITIVAALLYAVAHPREMGHGTRVLLQSLFH